MKKTITILFFIFGLATVNTYAKFLPRFSHKRVSSSVSSGLIVSARLRADRKALLVTFSNLNKVSDVSYTLMYQTNGVDQGVSGSLNLDGTNYLSRELLFGTCSSGVCRYHQNITNIKLEVTSQLPSGKKTLKRFRIRI